MRIAIPVSGASLEGSVFDSLGRAPWFYLYDTGVTRGRFVRNVAPDAAGGAGVLAAQLLVDQEVDAVLTPQCGKNAAEVFGSAKIRLVRTRGSGITENLSEFVQGQLEDLTEIHAGRHGAGRP